MIRAVAVLAAALPAAAQALPLTLTYRCERGVEIPAVYAETPDGSLAVISVEGRQVALLQERSGSGVRYGWPSGGSHYIWWTKGRSAQLLWSDGATGKEVSLYAHCEALP